MELVADDLATAVDLHQARLHQPIDVRVQAADTGRQFAREHVHRPLGEVHRRGAGEAVEIERAALGHVVGDVGDVHAQPEVAVGEPLDRDGVVEVAGVLAVDGDDVPAAEVGAAGEVGRSDGVVAAPRLGDGIGGVLVGDAVFAQDDLGVDAGIVEPAEHLDHPPRRHPGRTRPALDLHGDHVAVGRRQRIPRCHLHVGVEPGIERHDHRAAALEPDLADDLGAAPLEDLQHPALGPAVGASSARSAPAPDRRASRRRGCPRGRRRRRLPATSGSTNANPPAWPCSRPVISSRRSGRARRRPPIITRRAVGDQALQEPAERRALARRDAESCGQRARCLWRPGMTADGGENRIGVGHDGRGRGRRRQAYQAGEISSTCRSPTLVPVGPGCQRSPSCAKYA